MSNLSANILRSIVAAEFTVKPEQIRISGYAHELDTKKEWWGFFISANPFDWECKPFESWLCGTII